jgi:hypothetical protein
MAKRPDWNIEYLSDPEIYDAIRYLEPDPICRNAQYDAIRYLEPDPICRNAQKEDTAFVVCVAVIILVLGFLGFVWLWWR